MKALFALASLAFAVTAFAETPPAKFVIEKMSEFDIRYPTSSK